MKTPTIYASALLLLLAVAAHAQAPEPYSIRTGSGVYTELVNPSLVSVGPDSNGYIIPGINFSMNVFGSPMVFSPQGSLAIFPQGYIGIPTAYGKDSVMFVVESFYCLLRGDSASERTVALEGSGQKQILKVQWKNMRLDGHDPDDYVNFQLWLKKEDNSVEIHIGPNRITGNSGYWGLSGPVIGVSLLTRTIDSVIYGTHLAGPPTAPYLIPSAFYPLGGTPASGTIYRFVPNQVAGAAGQDDAGSTLRIVPNILAERSMLHLPAELGGKGARLLLYNGLGEEVRTIRDVSDGMVISRDDLPPGIYHAVVLCNGRAHGAGRLIVR